MKVSPATGVTSTLIVAGAPKFGVGMFLKVTVVDSPGLRKSIFVCLTILPPFDCSIVSVTGTPKTCDLPVLLTVTWKAMSTVTTMSVWVEVVSSLPDGSTFVEVSPVPHGQPVPAVEAPWSRETIEVIALVEASSAFCRNPEGGTSGPPLSFVPVTPW